MKKWIFIIGLIFCGQKLTAQNNCENIIEEATDLYNSGHYDECIQLLENGLNICPLSKNKKEKAYVLLINSNIEKDSLQAIDKNFRLLLKNNPSFKIKDYTGPDDFSKKFNNYYVYPKLSFGIRPHFSNSNVLITRFYQALATPNIKNDTQFEVTKSNLNTNFILEYRLLEKISFFADAGFFSIEFDRFIEDKYWNMTSVEKLRYFQLDFGSKFYLLKSQKKLNFYLMGGFSNQYLKKSVLTITEKKNIVNDPNGLYGAVDTEKPDFLKDFNSKNLRNPYVVSLQLGTGAMYRIGNFGIGLDIRTYISLNTLNNRAARFSEPDLIQKYNYIDSDTRLLKSDYSLVFTYLFYKVKKKPIRN